MLDINYLPDVKYSRSIRKISFTVVVYLRNCLGRNDNPNVIEFASAFRKLLICHPVMTSHDHNVITNATGILTVSSRNLLSSASHKQTQVFELEIDPELLNYEILMLKEIEMIEPYEQHMCAYIASCIEKKFIQNTNTHKYKCNECVNVLLFSNERIVDGLLEMKSEEIKQPSASTVKIVIFSNAVMKLVCVENPQGNNINAVCKVIYENVDMEDLFNNMDFNHSDDESSTSHKQEFITLLIKTYLSLKSQRIGKKISDKERGELIRYRRKRAVIVAGQ